MMTSVNALPLHYHRKQEMQKLIKSHIHVFASLWHVFIIRELERTCIAIKKENASKKLYYKRVNIHPYHKIVLRVLFVIH